MPQQTNTPITRITNAQQIKDIIAPIPADKFISSIYYKGIDPKNPEDGCCCFIGHINMAIGKSADADRYGFGARQLTKLFLREVHGEDGDGTSVNNSDCINGYNEPVIKDRLIHMIDDMIAHGY